jgi:hypothetical protein
LVYCSIQENFKLFNQSLRNKKRLSGNLWPFYIAPTSNDVCVCVCVLVL